MDIDNNNKKVSQVKWLVFGLAFGTFVGAILGILAYNKQWLG